MTDTCDTPAERVQVYLDAWKNLGDDDYDVLDSIDAIELRESDLRALLGDAEAGSAEARIAELVAENEQFFYRWATAKSQAELFEGALHEVSQERDGLARQLADLLAPGPVDDEITPRSVREGRHSINQLRRKHGLPEIGLPGGLTPDLIDAVIRASFAEALRAAGDDGEPPAAIVYDEDEKHILLPDDEDPLPHVAYMDAVGGAFKGLGGIEPRTWWTETPDGQELIAVFEFDDDSQVACEWPDGVYLAWDQRRGWDLITEGDNRATYPLEVDGVPLGTYAHPFAVAFVTKRRLLGEPVPSPLDTSWPEAEATEAAVQAWHEDEGGDAS